MKSKEKQTKDYRVNTYANGFGIWHSEITFLTPMGNTGEAERVIFNALANAKRKIRQAIQERQNDTVKRLSYFISESQELGTGQLVWLVIREK
jgi:hypothetical protein